MILKLFLIFTCVVFCNAKSYENYKVYSVEPKTEIQVQRLTDLQKSGFEFWNDVIAVDSDVRVMVSPEKNNEFLNYTKTVGLNTELRINDVQELINAQLKPADDVRSARLGSFSWNAYHSLQEIHAWLDELQDMYPDVVSTVTIGTSHGGRQIKGVIIDFKSGNRDDKPLTAMIEGGIHAREWISPATVTFIIKEFLTSDDADVRSLAENFVWHIFPVVNPDGYVYTFTDDRMWRKNRNPANSGTCAGNTANDLSNGIDLNRNFDFLWMTTGASSNPCSTTYAGPIPSSELEAQAIINYVQQLKRDGSLLYYFAFHSFSQMILVPFSHVSGFDVLEAENYGDLFEIAIRGAAKLEAVHGTRYTVGTSADILYEVSGSSFDWVKGVAEVPIVYLFELRDLGENGFLLPANQIIPNSEEIMACLLEMDRTTRAMGYYTGKSSTILAGFISLMISSFVLIALQ